ncbi:MAG: ABC transporter permease [Candidatus Omnitrophica bacterium]|nr:ABC transporter permease [Candidatus Omnitrophota bacterium]
MILNKIKDKLWGFVLPLLVLITWEIVTRLELFPIQLLVPPKQVVFTFIDLLKKGDLLTHLRISFMRVLAGFAIGTSIGFIFGTAMGLSRRIEKYFGPLFHAVRQVPLLGWMPLLMLWLGIGEAFKVVLISIGAFYPVVLNTFEGVRSVPKEYAEVAQVFEYSKFKLLRKVIIPAALPSILTGIRIALSMSWLLLVGAELMAASEGVGFLMTQGRRFFQTDVVMVGVLIIGVIGLVINNTVARIEKYFLRWSRTFEAG